jgi:hypothetical protein
MSAYTIQRPIWRKFRPRFLDRAALHVRRGGHAVVVQDGEVEVILGVDDKGKITELGYWSLLAVEQQRWRRVKEGPAAGLATARIKPHFAGSVLDWCDRDSIHPGPTRTIHLDCLDCAACCHESNVLLDEDDFQRWRDGGRKDLISPAYIKRKDGKITLRFLPKDEGRCQHLGADKKCGIYLIRPDNCSVFVVGSEACLAAREDTLGIRDGAPPNEFDIDA